MTDGNNDGGAGGNAGGDNGGAGGAKPWHDGIDAELIGHWDLKGWKKDDARTVAVEATKQARELQKHFGVPADQLLKLPKDASDEAGWKGVYSRLGVPAEAKEYDLSAVKFSDGKDLDPALADAMRGALLGARVPKDRAADVVKAVVTWRENADKSASSERTAKLNAERSELQKSWGTNFDFNKLKAMEGARRLGVDPATVDGLEQQVGYAKIMEMFRKIGAGTSEDTFHDGAPGGAGHVATRDGAVARKAELMRDNGWVERYNKGGVEEVREMQGLNRWITGVTEQWRAAS